MRKLPAPEANRPLRVLVVPAERHPNQESFLEEVFTRGDERIDVQFLQRSSLEEGTCVTKWNLVPARLFPERSRSRLVNQFMAYAFDVRYVSHMWRALREFRPDVVYARDMTFPLFVALLTQGICGHRVVFQKTFPHELRWTDPRTVAAHRWPQLWAVLRKLEIIFQNWMLTLSDLVIPISEAMGLELIAALNLDPRSVHAFGMGIPEELRRLSPGVRGENEPIRLVYLGTLAASRRLDRMLRAFAVAKESSTKALTLEVLGGSPDEVSRLEALAQDLGLQQDVEFTGRLPRGDVYARLARCDLNLAYIADDPRFRVASPTKILESLAAGVPVVATGACLANAELAALTGAVVIAGDGVEDYAAGLRAALDRLDELALRSRDARVIVCDRFSYDALRDRMVELLLTMPRGV